VLPVIWLWLFFACFLFLELNQHVLCVTTGTPRRWLVCVSCEVCLGMLCTDASS